MTPRYEFLNTHSLEFCSKNCLLRGQKSFLCLSLCSCFSALDNDLPDDLLGRGVRALPGVGVQAQLVVVGLTTPQGAVTPTEP